MHTLDTWQIGLKGLAEIEGVPVDTLKTYRQRYGLLGQVRSHRGLPVMFCFADALDTRLAFILMRLGFDKAEVCQHLGGRISFFPFLEGRPVEISLRDGKLSHHRILNVDPFVSIPMEADGWEVAEAFLADIREHKGAEAEVAARRHLEEGIAKARSQ